MSYKRNSLLKCGQCSRSFDNGPRTLSSCDKINQICQLCAVKIENTNFDCTACQIEAELKLKKEFSQTTQAAELSHDKEKKTLKSELNDLNALANRLVLLIC